MKHVIATAWLTSLGVASLINRVAYLDKRPEFSGHREWSEAAAGPDDAERQFNRYYHQHPEEFHPKDMAAAKAAHRHDDWADPSEHEHEHEHHHHHHHHHHHPRRHHHKAQHEFDLPADALEIPRAHHNWFEALKEELSELSRHFSWTGNSEAHFDHLDSYGGHEEHPLHFHHDGHMKSDSEWDSHFRGHSHDPHNDDLLDQLAAGDLSGLPDSLKRSFQKYADHALPTHHYNPPHHHHGHSVGHHHARHHHDLRADPTLPPIDDHHAHHHHHHHRRHHSHSTTMIQLDYDPSVHNGAVEYLHSIE